MSVVESHQISLIYTLEGVNSGELISRSLGGGVFADILPSDLAEAVSTNLDGATVWLAQSKSGTHSDRFSSDLAAPIRNLISGDNVGQLQRFQLSQECAQILQFGDLPAKYNAAVSKKMICLELGKQAAKRVAEQGVTPRPLWINPTHTELLQFGTGATIAVVQVEIMRLKDPAGAAEDDRRELSFVELQEAVHALSRFNTCRWYERDTSVVIVSDVSAYGPI